MAAILISITLTFFCACNGGGGSSQTQPPPTPPITINSVAPWYGVGNALTSVQFAIAGQGSFQLLANGTGFTPSTVLEWNGAVLPTQFGDSTDLAANVSSSLIAKPGTVSITAKDTATGAVSNTVPFGIASPAALTAGAVQLVTAAPDGTPANGDSLVEPSISSTGRYVAFQSVATNLVPGPASGYQEIYERDTCVAAPSGCTPTTIRITVTYDGSAVNDHSYDSAVTADGRYVAFASAATNILPNTPFCSVHECVFLRDTCTGAASGCSPITTMASTAADGTPADGESPAITPDGRFVAFTSSGTSPGVWNVFLRDTCNAAQVACTPSTILISSSDGGTPGDFNSGPQAVSATGRYVTFDSWADDLVPNGPTDGNDHLYLRDTCIGAPSGCTPNTTWLDSRGSRGTGGAGLNSAVVPAISANGRLVAFSTLSVGLVPQDVQGNGNVYVRDTCIGVTSGCTPSASLASAGNDGSVGNDPSLLEGHDGISADGRFVAFESLASNLVPGDTFSAGGWKDIFVRDTCFGAPSGCSPSTVRVSVVDAPDIATEANAISDHASISADGHYVVFLSSATNLVSPPANGHTMVYLAKTGF
jgi:Tol biopolymer transport system component